MSLPLSRQVRLLRAPEGLPVLDDFAVVDVEVGEPRDGEALVRNAFVSVDPFMRMSMSSVHPVLGRPAAEVGEPLSGGAVGEVVASRTDAFREGDWVVHQAGWRELSTIRGDDDGLRTIDPACAPVSTALGVLGMPGLTAWAGLRMFEPQGAGRTVYVSAAAGTVGSIAAQLAARAGATVITSAGSERKRAWLESLGIGPVFDYREGVRESLARLAPDGVDLYFDNVGGRHLEAVIDELAFHGRVVACGAISVYNDVEASAGPRNLDLLFTKELTIRGVRSRAHRHEYPEFLAEVAPLVASGALRYEETVAQGIEQAPAAFIGLFSGENLGKMLVAVGPS
ncbi:MAG: NADP-dependent oxidoreductase [Actinomycetota bacterium]